MGYNLEAFEAQAYDESEQELTTIHLPQIQFRPAV
jgi:hypothetical protein